MLLLTVDSASMSNSAGANAGGEGKGRGAAAAAARSAATDSSFTCAAGVGHTAGVNAARTAATDDDTASAAEEEERRSSEFEIKSPSACAGGVRMSGEGEGGRTGGIEAAASNAVVCEDTGDLEPGEQGLSMVPAAKLARRVQDGFIHICLSWT